MELSEVIKEPLITEKTVALTAENKYTFLVDRRASKPIIEKAVEEFFKVKVKKIWVINLPGKKRTVGRFRNRTIRTSAKKKAIVKLAEGDKIDLFETGAAA